MRKGKRIEIVIESVDRHGVITAEIIPAKVLYDQGDNITVMGDDGFVYEVDYNVRADNGAFKVI